MMLSIITSSKFNLYPVFISAIVTVLFTPTQIQAQTGILEEVMVTAQRREQSIQEVPISLEMYTGDLLNQQGFRAMEDLANFSPSVEIDVRFQDQDVAVRGLGTTGNNLGLEQAVPIFVDGVHFGRTSMVMGAFLDLERVEVLRGPQPIAFGQNATAGAFSLITKKPGPEWSGDMTAEYGNWGRTSVEGGIGGPITDTLGIRVAGQYDRMTGYIRDIVSNEMFPNSQENAARVTLQWNPTENLEATLKGEYAGRRREGDGNAVCRTEGDVPQTERAATIPGQTLFTEFKAVLPYPTDCDKGFKRVGIREGHFPFFSPVQGIDQEDVNGGIVDITKISDTLMERNDAHDNMDAYNYRLGLNYMLNNGISLDSNTAYVDYQRAGAYDNSSSPIPTNFQHRGEIFDMMSQEFRVLSPRGGKIEWEAGIFYQTEDLDLGNVDDDKYETVTIRANTRRPYRTQISWQDTEWKSAFASFTFNFMDNMASLDIGARYTDVSKQSYIQGLAATWIFDINPFTNDFDGNDAVASATQHTDGDRRRNVSAAMINCATGHPQCGSYGAGFWTHEYNPPGSRRAVPDAWDTLSPVDIGPVLFGIRRGSEDEIYFRDYKDNNLDPQVTLRYRPTDTMSLYAKWARAFKGGGADISSGSLPSSQEAFLLEAEYAENFELGAKGTLLDGTANYNVTLFNIVISDLQIATASPSELGASSFSTNAGKQRTRGVEFDARWAASDQLTLGLSGALMDGVMLDYTGAGCTDVEFELADTGPCLSAQESIDLYGTDDFEGTIDRTGSKAPRTPDFKFIFDADWWGPIGDRHKYMLSSKVSLIDEHIFVVEDFDEILKYPTRVVANLNAGFGDINDTWDLSFWVRNLLNQGMRYYPEFDVLPRGRVDNSLSPRNWRSYGVQFNYKFN